MNRVRDRDDGLDFIPAPHVFAVFKNEDFAAVRHIWIVAAHRQHLGM